ncbi:MAG: cold shock domain-containing protein, partial [Candidatus Aenigmarchaeota archaeon]|nr:cold shock domain-containing protein [Candidatus Aenigmarchaeota archaeon]
MVKGSVKFFNDMKKFGFIAGDEGTEYFVHSTGL